MIAEELTYVDGEGFVWTLNLFSAGVSEAVQRPQDVYYDGPDCTGTAYTYLSRPPASALEAVRAPRVLHPARRGANQLEVGTIRLASYRVEVAGDVQCVPGIRWPLGPWFVSTTWARTPTSSRPP